MQQVASLDALVDVVQETVRQESAETLITQRVLAALEELLASGWKVPEDRCRPHDDHYVMYPLYVAADDSFSIASAVWGVGQGTPVHGHETWGVVGIYRGVEHEVRYDKSARPSVPLTRRGTYDWSPGQVTVCCTTDDDVHQVSCGSDEPCVGVHVYGRNIGTLSRRAYDPATGEVSWFVSGWPQD